jgi:hypothetical protein
MKSIKGLIRDLYVHYLTKLLGSHSIISIRMAFSPPFPTVGFAVPD